MSTTYERLKNYEGIDSDKENNNVSNKEEEINKNHSDVKQKVKEGQINSVIKNENTLSHCKEHICQVDTVLHQGNDTNGNAEAKSNDQDGQGVGIEPLIDKAVKKKLKKQRQRLRLRKISDKINPTEEIKTNVMEAVNTEVKDHELQKEFVKADSPTTSSEYPKQDQDIKDNSNKSDDSDEDIDFLNNIPAFVHAVIKKDNKKQCTTIHKRTKEEDDITKVNIGQKNLSSETLNNDDNNYDSGMQHDFTLVKYKHSKHADSLRSGEDFATLTIKFIIENQISLAIQHLTTAISLDPKNVCYYTNRSFCYLRTGAYASAIRDATFVTKNTSDNVILSKANYVLGEAYYGLKNYEEAEKKIQKCLDLFPQNLCYIRESLRFKISQLVNMGFCERDAVLALKKHSTVMDAMETLIAENSVPKTNNNSTNGCDTIFMCYDETEIFYSDDEDNCSNAQLLSSIIKEKFPFHRNRINKRLAKQNCEQTVKFTK